MVVPKITTFLMFNGQAEEAINLYIEAFEDAEILAMVKYDENDEEPPVPLKSGGAILMPRTEMPPFREFTWIIDKYGVNFQLALPNKK